MLLRVVTAQGLAIVKGPLADGLKVNAVRARGNKGRVVRPHREEILALEYGQGWLVKTASLGNRVFRSMLLVGQGMTVESASYDDAGVVMLGRISPVPYRQQDISTRQVDALRATGIGTGDRKAGMILAWHGEQFHVAPLRGSWIHDGVRHFLS